MLLTFTSVDDAARAHAAIARDLPAGMVRLAACTRRFDGAVQSDLTIHAAAVAPVAVRKLADVIVGIVEARAAREVSLDGASLRGVPAEEVRARLALRASPPPRRPSAPGEARP